MTKSLTAYQRKVYTQMKNSQESEFARLTDGYLHGMYTDTIHDAFKQELKNYYLRLALIAKGGRALTTKDKADMGVLLAKSYDYLDGFISDLTDYKAKNKIATDQGAISRGASYDRGWHVFSRYSIPGAIADALPALPGLDCLGGALCGCFLEWDVTADTVEVWWRLSPIKIHCVLCSDFAVEWDPYEIPLDELDPDLVEQDSDFIYG